VQIEDDGLFLQPSPSSLSRRMTARLWGNMLEGNEKEEDGVEDRVAALRLQEFLKKHKDNMELGLLARANETSSQFDERINKLFEMRRPTGELIHRMVAARVHWLKSWVTTPFLIAFLEQNWSHVNFSPFMTLEDVENRLMHESSAIVVRLSSTIPGFITVSCNAKETQQPIHVRYQVRSDLTIRGEQDISYPNFAFFIASFDHNAEGAPNPNVIDFEHEILEVQPLQPAFDEEIAPANDPGAALSKPDPGAFKEKSSIDPISRIGPQQPHVALYARTSDIKTWVKDGKRYPNEGGEGEVTMQLANNDAKEFDGRQPTICDMSGGET